MTNEVESPEAYVLGILWDFFQDTNKVKLWLETDNPMLGGVSPNHMIAIGRAEKLAKFVELACLENGKP